METILLIVAWGHRGFGEGVELGIPYSLQGGNRGNLGLGWVWGNVVCG